MSVRFLSASVIASRLGTTQVLYLNQQKRGDKAIAGLIGRKKVVGERRDRFGTLDLQPRRPLP